MYFRDADVADGSSEAADEMVTKDWKLTGERTVLAVTGEQESGRNYTLAVGAARKKPARKKNPQP